MGIVTGSNIHFMEKVGRLSLEPSDIIVLKTRGALSQEVLEKFRAIFREQIGVPNKVLVLDDGMEIGVLSPRKDAA